MAKKIKAEFRKSLHGYNKEDVNAYILKVDNEIDDQYESYRKEISDLKAQIEDYTVIISSINGLKQKLADTESQLEVLQEKLKYLERIEEEEKKNAPPAETVSETIPISEDIKEDIINEVNNETEIYIEEFDIFANDVKSKLTRLIDEFEKSYSDISLKIQYLSDNLNKNIEKKIGKNNG